MIFIIGETSFFKRNNCIFEHIPSVLSYCQKKGLKIKIKLHHSPPIVKPILDPRICINNFNLAVQCRIPKSQQNEYFNYDFHYGIFSSSGK